MVRSESAVLLHLLNRFATGFTARLHLLQLVTFVPDVVVGGKFKRNDVGLGNRKKRAGYVVANLWFRPTIPDTNIVNHGAFS